MPFDSKRNLIKQEKTLRFKRRTNHSVQLESIKQKSLKLNPLLQRILGKSIALNWSNALERCKNSRLENYPKIEAFILEKSFQILSFTLKN